MPFILFITAIVNLSWRSDIPLPVKSDLGIMNQYKLFYNLGVKFTYYNMAYDSLHLNLQGLSEKAFIYALDGFEELQQEGVAKNDSIITIIDFDQPSTRKRMYILDLKNYKVLFNTWVAHGKNTGTLMAASFGNTMSSNKSSLGFYVTDEPYYGGNGYSLKLIGLEKGINDQALQRAIVLHGAAYVSQSSINQLGYLGRSFGCPAVPRELSRPIIETIKEGSVLFIYNSSYMPTIKYVYS